MFHQQPHTIQVTINVTDDGHVPFPNLTPKAEIGRNVRCEYGNSSISIPSIIQLRSGRLLKRFFFLVAERYCNLFSRELKRRERLYTLKTVLPAKTEGRPDRTQWR